MNIVMKSTLAANLKKLVRDNDMTMAQLSRATKVPSQTLNNWMSGLDPRNINQVKKIAGYFGITIDELVYGVTIEKTKLLEYEDEINAGFFEVVLRRKK